ncbi:MAG: Rrf2 family transcriptional regulator [Candidatus Omnitrophota bacterium]|nr:Rrf2 family transcriptional regulator [Candidatus Omnitrophota bacterium]MBU3929304.1 Rrf2 family transcriptional regulator [bacterium]MBU4122389.1 Rrf2 family transcriptional regulator [bacterium]
MKLSTKLRYGVRGMLDLAKQDGKGTVLLKDIAARQSISESYLANIFGPLVGAKLVVSKRGCRGGFNLGRKASKIKLSEIAAVIDGPISLVDCISKAESCKKISSCAVRVVWARMEKALNEVLESITLQELVRIDADKTGKLAKMYHI